MAKKPPKNQVFGERENVRQVEEGETFCPKFDAAGLIPAITTDAESGDVLMLGYMNEKALKLSIKTGTAHYWSRSRKTLWKKGETSGLVQRILELRVDDDQDALWLRVKVEGIGASCHVGYRSCFYRAVPVAIDSKKLVFKENDKSFDPLVVYGDTPNPTQL